LNSILEGIFQNGTFEAKRKILTTLGSDLVWNDEKLLIYNRKSVEILISDIKSLKPVISKFGNEKALVEQGLSDENSTLCITLRAT
jgi:hypothetical protein